ncbi:MAG: transporter substrate-binding domain-containing protein [Burkholderiales bacterium]|nr:transporter substrate-binding domain-containing protein [Burkholderiales bacterium]
MFVPAKCLLMFGMISAAYAADVVLRVAGQEGVPPKFIYESGTVTGICPDILRAIEQSDAGVRFVGDDKPLSVPLIEQQLENGTADIACALIDTPRRRSVANRVEFPLYSVHERVAVRIDDNVEVNDLAGLVRAGGIIVTFSGAAYAPMLRRLGATVDDSNADAISGMRRVQSGHARFLYMSDLAMERALHESHMEGQIKILPVVLNTEPLYMWVSAKLPGDVLHRIEHAVAQLSTSGTLSRIYDKYEAH